MIHPDTELRLVNDQIGLGVFATQLIPAGTITFVRDPLDVEVPPDSPLLAHPVLGERVEKYSYIDPSGARIVSWDIGKYVNHSNDCNTMSTGWGFEIALRDIAAGEEITDEYGLFNMQCEMPVYGGACSQRTAVRPDDFDRFADGWDGMVRGALSRLNDVPQPLMSLIDPATHRELMVYLNTGRNYRSVRVLRYRPISRSRTAPRRRRRVRTAV